MGFEPTTFELEVQRASPLRHSVIYKLPPSIYIRKILKNLYHIKVIIYIRVIITNISSSIYNVKIYSVN